jgi:hypothetical protein
MFRVCLVPQTPFFPQGLNFAHRIYAVRGGFQERNLANGKGVLHPCHHSEDVTGSLDIV